MHAVHMYEFVCVCVLCARAWADKFIYKRHLKKSNVSNIMFHTVIKMYVTNQINTARKKRNKKICIYFRSS